VIATVDDDADPAIDSNLQSDRVNPPDPVRDGVPIAASDTNTNDAFELSDADTNDEVYDDVSSSADGDAALLPKDDDGE